MNIFILAFSATLLGAQLFLPRRFAFLPLIIGAIHLGKAEIFGPFTTTQVLILTGIARAIVGGFFEFNFRAPNAKIIVFMAVYLLFSSLFHDNSSGNPLIARIGLCLNILGTFLYAQSYIKNFSDFHRYSVALCYVLFPLAIFMAMENRSAQNSYTLLGARNPEAASRDGRIRAQGPFAHSILAGTLGATSIPIAFIAWKRRRNLALLGLGSCAVIVYSSSSSGPILTSAAAIGSLYLWKYRRSMSSIKMASWLLVIAASLAMWKPPWHLIARANIVGGSTGWHRARLMDKGLEHLDTWWLAGTDYTRNWMASGVNWSDNHVDMTNYFLHLGVIGGLPVVICLILLITKSLKHIGIRYKTLEQNNNQECFMLWIAGASLFAHAITFLSVSYYDQMFVMFYFLIGAITALVTNEENLPEATSDHDRAYSDTADIAR